WVEAFWRHELHGEPDTGGHVADVVEARLVHPWDLPGPRAGLHGRRVVPGCRRVNARKRSTRTQHCRDHGRCAGGWSGLAQRQLLEVHRARRDSAEDAAARDRPPAVAREKRDGDELALATGEV